MTSFGGRHSSSLLLVQWPQHHQSAALSAGSEALKQLAITALNSLSERVDDIGVARPRHIYDSDSDAEGCSDEDTDEEPDAEFHPRVCPCCAHKAKLKPFLDDAASLVQPLDIRLGQHCMVKSIGSIYQYAAFFSASSSGFPASLNRLKLTNAQRYAKMTDAQDSAAAAHWFVMGLHPADDNGHLLLWKLDGQQAQMA